MGLVDIIMGLVDEKWGWWIWGPWMYYVYIDDF